MGSDRFYPKEQPVREVSVDGFAIDHGLHDANAASGGEPGPRFH